MKLIDCLAEFDPKIVDDYSGTIKDSPLNDINPILSIRKGGMDLSSIQSKLQKQKGDEYNLPIWQLKNILWELIEEKKIEHNLRNYKKTRGEATKQKGDEYNLPIWQLKNILWELIEEKKIEHNLRNYKKTRGEATHFLTKFQMFIGYRGYKASSSSSGNRKGLLNVVLIGDPADVGKSALRKQFTAQEDDAHFETDNTRFTILDVDRQGQESSIPNIISRADIGVLVISSLPGEFGNVFVKDGLTSRLLTLAKIHGVSELLVAVNKMDHESVQWSPKRFRMPISKTYGNNGTFVLGKVEYGTVKTGDRMLIMPNNVPVTVSEIYINKDKVTIARPGETLRVQVKGVKETDISAGSVLCSSEKTLAAVLEFIADLYILDLQNASFDVGSNLTLHVHSLAVECEVLELICVSDKSTPSEEYLLPVKKGAFVTCRIKLSSGNFKESSQSSIFYIPSSPLLNIVVFVTYKFFFSQRHEIHTDRSNPCIFDSFFSFYSFTQLTTRLMSSFSFSVY
ncbi:Elongation factor, GTP-binding domain-containing protein [Artemisia annua]|uniref:Elongation factor, GTP-binding domain-containing protein n=1 Tax=Artemisia annua TaxID=35608 RepID=A0A2U1PPL7_ARTAN|nr:Elongation factor, GTP-binding domain-containing protein [Artemisia annua]